MTERTFYLLGVLICIFIPPLIICYLPGNGQAAGGSNAGMGGFIVMILQLTILIVLTLLFWLPGVIYALILLFKAGKINAF
jgi:uncharacterized membrane protein YqaE (UPF0057 family)